MLKIFRKIRQGLLDKRKVSKYLVYASGEIVLVVIGILIALQINNWNSLKILEKEKMQTYKEIKRQINEDINEIIQVRDLNNYYSGKFEKANDIISNKDRTKIDSLAILTIMLSQYSDFNGSGNIFETLINSGNIKLIKNTNVSSSLQQLEMTYSYLNKLEDIHWEVIMNELSPELKGVINYSNLEIVKPEKLYSVELQNIIIESIFLTKGKDSIYSKALKEMNAIIDLIDLELNN